MRVSAPTEGGKANKAIEAVIAESLGLKASQVEVVAGMTNPVKTVRVTGVERGVVKAWVGSLKG